MDTVVITWFNNCKINYLIVLIKNSSISFTLPLCILGWFFKFSFSFPFWIRYPCSHYEGLEPGPWTMSSMAGENWERLKRMHVFLGVQTDHRPPLITFLIQLQALTTYFIHVSVFVDVFVPLQVLNFFFLCSQSRAVDFFSSSLFILP